MLKWEKDVQKNPQEGTKRCSLKKQESFYLESYKNDNCEL